MSSGSPTFPSATARANNPNSTARTKSVTAMMRNRSQRSASAPATRPSSSQDVYSAACTSATFAGSWVSRAASSGIATKVSPSPADDTTADVQNRQNRPPSPGPLTSAVPAARGRPAGRPPARAAAPSSGRSPARCVPVVARDTRTITAKAVGTVHAAGWASRAPVQPPRSTPAIVADTASVARPPPASSPAMAPTSVSPRHQMPSSSSGQNDDAATANARPTTSATGSDDAPNDSRNGTLTASAAAIRKSRTDPRRASCDSTPRDRDGQAGRRRQERGERAGGRPAR